MNVTPTRKNALVRLLGLLLVAVFVVAACSSNSTIETTEPAADEPENTNSGSDPEPEPEPEPTDEPASASDEPEPEPTDPPAEPEPEPTDEPEDDEPSFSGSGSGNFCALSIDLNENDPFESDEFPIFSEEFFNAVTDLIDDVGSVAPPEIQGDFATLSAGFSQMQDLAAQYDYNLFDPDFGTAFEALDTTAMDEASENIDAYVEQVCGLEGGIGGSDGATEPSGDPTEGLEDLPEALDNLSPEQAEQLSQVFLYQLGIDEETAQCLIDELGDVTEAFEDPSILTMPVCGTTLLDIISGVNG